MSAPGDVAQAHQTELEAIKQVVARVEHSQNNELPEEFVDLFRADAIWTTGHGKRLFGRDAIATFTRQVLPDLSPLPSMLMNHRYDILAWNGKMAKLLWTSTRCRATSAMRCGCAC